MSEPATRRKDVTDEEEVAATDVRDRLTELMNRASYMNQRFIVTVHGNRVAALVSMADLGRLRALDGATA